jgi:hypothetical protein
MADQPVNANGIRRWLNVSPAEMTDADLRRCLAVLACDFDPTGWPEKVAERARSEPCGRRWL